MELSHLEARFLNLSRRLGIPPNPSILSSFQKVRKQKSNDELLVFEVHLDKLSPPELALITDLFTCTCLSGVDWVDVMQESAGQLHNGDRVLALLRSTGEKLRLVDIRDWPIWKSTVRDISEGGLACQILNLRFSPIWKLNMTGNFTRLQTLNLDFSVSLSSFRESCFSCMPNLMHISMCETSISNLWTTSAALSKLSSLVELRFQNCFCCSYSTGACPTLSGSEAIPCAKMKTSFVSREDIFSHMQYIINNEISDDESSTIYHSIQSTTEESFDSELDFSASWHGPSDSIMRYSDINAEFDEGSNQEINVNKAGQNLNLNSASLELPFDLPEDVPCSKYSSAEKVNIIDVPENLLSNDVVMNGANDDYNVVCEAPATSVIINESCSEIVRNEVNSKKSLDLSVEKHASHHPSPICFEKHYRDYMMFSLPQLKVLDNLPINIKEREKAKLICKQYFEISPYDRGKNSVASILRNREMGMGRSSNNSMHSKIPYTSKESSYSFSRSLSSAKVSSSPWPSLSPISELRTGEITNTFRPRQFEYHSSNTSLMVFGTLDGEVVVINHENGKVVGYVPAPLALHSILGLCWLKNHPSKLIAGSDNGSLKLYDVNQMPSLCTDKYSNMDAPAFAFDEFEHLTSVHVNSTDEIFLASGFSTHVALYDIGSGKCLQMFKDLHLDHINVVKFAHHSRSIFATSSFDKKIKLWDLRQGPSQPCYTICSSRGNVMVCFSPDDQYLLSSAVDNEVKQHLAVDGRLHMAFDIASTRSMHNYTRSYYMNGRDYIISGSSEESIVRVCCAQTGRRLKDITLEVGRGSGKLMFVQSLRGDPFRLFHMSVLGAFWRPSSKFQILRINLLSSGGGTEDDCCVGLRRPAIRMGG